MDIDELDNICFKLIARKANDDILHPISAENLGYYVKGIVDLETELFDSNTFDMKEQKF